MTKTVRKLQAVLLTSSLCCRLREEMLPYHQHLRLHSQFKISGKGRQTGELRTHSSRLLDEIAENVASLHVYACRTGSLINSYFWLFTCEAFIAFTECRVAIYSKSNWVDIVLLCSIQHTKISLTAVKQNKQRHFKTIIYFFLFWKVHEQDPEIYCSIWFK